MCVYVCVCVYIYIYIYIYIFFFFFPQKKNLVHKSVQPSKNGSYENIQGFSKNGTNMYAQNTKPVVTQEGKKAQLAANSKNSRLFYQIIKELYGPQQSIFAPLKSKDGATLRRPEDIKKRWCEHDSKLLNRHPVVDESVLDIIWQHDPIMALDEVPSRGEIKASVSQMNNNKVPGMDGITAEILKNGAEKMIDLLEQVIQSVWEHEVLQDWRDVILVSLYKKDLKSDCSNFRGMSLLSIVEKLFSRIILDRLVCTIVNRNLPELQCGFCASHSTVDMIFSARQLQEKCKEQNLPLYQCFIDLSKAFDTVNRSTLWKILLKLGCPERFVGLICSLHNGMKARVSFNGTLSEEISINNGVKQGDISAPMLFNIYFAIVFLVAFYENSDSICIRYRTSSSFFNVHRLLSQRKVSSSLVRKLLYVDDCDIVAHSEDEFQCSMNHFVSACNSFGLKINLKKTDVMYDPAPGSPYIEPTIFVEGNKLDVVHSFVYLGSTLFEGCSLDGEISFRIERASQSFSAFNKRVWSQHDIKLHMKITVYKVCVLSALLYTSETWTLYKHQLKLLCLRQILHIKWQSHVSDTEILGEAWLPSIQSMVMKSCL